MTIAAVERKPRKVTLLRGKRLVLVYDERGKLIRICSHEQAERDYQVTDDQG